MAIPTPQTLAEQAILSVYAKELAEMVGQYTAAVEVAKSFMVITKREDGSYQMIQAIKHIRESFSIKSLATAKYLVEYARELLVNETMSKMGII